MRLFAKGLRQDLAAVRNAVTMEWSNGQTEGQVNRLKMLKRQMYGRANFDLLAPTSTLKTLEIGAFLCLNLSQNHNL